MFVQMFGDDRSPLSSAEDDDDDGVALIANPPHNEFNPGGTNTLYTVFLIVNAALGAGDICLIFIICQTHGRYHILLRLIFYQFVKILIINGHFVSFKPTWTNIAI